MGLILGIDYGTQHIGLALSDETELVADTLDSLRAEKNRTIAELVARFIEKSNLAINHLVIGIPLGIAGKPTKKSKEVRQFAEELKKLTSINYTLWNETGTSIEASSIIGSNIHSNSAKIILQAYLDFKRSGI